MQDKVCPLRLIADASVGDSVLFEARCLTDYCAMYDPDTGHCGLVMPAIQQGLNLIIKEMKGE